MGEEASPVVDLNQIGMGGIIDILGADAAFLGNPGGIGPQVDESAALVEVQAGTHIGIGIPEIFLVAAVKDVLPQGALAAIVVRVALPVEIGKFRHGHIQKLPFCLQLAVVLHAIVIGLGQQFIGSFPAAAAVQPAGAYEHHIIAVAIVVLAQVPVLVDEVIQVGVLKLPFLIVIDHTPEHILGMGAEIGAVAVEAGHQIPGQMGNGDDTAVIVCIRSGTMGIDL